MAENWKRSRPGGCSDPALWDAALRLSDAVTHHLLGAGEAARFRWLAIRLSDGGGGERQLYDSRQDAIDAQLHSGYYAYLRITPDGMSPRSAWRWLAMARQVYSQHRTRHDIEAAAPILPMRVEDVRRLWRASA